MDRVPTADIEKEVLADFEKPDTSFKSAGIAGRGSDPPTML